MNPIWLIAAFLYGMFVIAVWYRVIFDPVRPQDKMGIEDWICAILFGWLLCPIIAIMYLIMLWYEN